MKQDKSLNDDYIELVQARKLQMLEIFIEEGRPSLCYTIQVDHFGDILEDVCYFCLIDSTVDDPPELFCTLIDDYVNNAIPVCENWHISKALLELI